MSHSTNTRGGTIFIHNGDYSGCVRISTAEFPMVSEYVDVPIEDLIEFVVGYIREKRIEDIERMTEANLLGITSLSVLPLESYRHR